MVASTVVEFAIVGVYLGETTCPQGLIPGNQWNYVERLAAERHHYIAELKLSEIHHSRRRTTALEV
jgi:hypothetical protein